MEQFDWQVPNTEEGLVQVLQQIEKCRQAENMQELGRSLLALSHLVKWVRSDNQTPSFLRSQELAVEAAAVFRSVQDNKGLVKALVAASAGVNPKTSAEYLSESEKLAEEISDPEYRAMVLGAR